MITLFVSFMSTQCALHIGTRHAQLFQVPPPHPPPLVTVRLCQSTDSCEPRDALSCTDSPPLAARCRRLPLEASNCGFDKLLMSAEKECARHTDMHWTDHDHLVCVAHVYTVRTPHWHSSRAALSGSTTTPSSTGNCPALPIDGLV